MQPTLFVNGLLGFGFILEITRNDTWPTDTNLATREGLVCRKVVQLRNVHQLDLTANGRRANMPSLGLTYVGMRGCSSPLRLSITLHNFAAEGDTDKS